MSCLSPRCSHGTPQVGYVEIGAGETVLLLHGSASSSAMWRKAIDALAPLYRAVAPDLIGYGQSAPWTGAAAFTLDAERRALKPLLPCCERFHLVGYSYGGAVALQLALHNPVRVNTLTLIEPVFFAALRYGGESGDYETLQRTRMEFVDRLACGARDGAMEHFIDFWTAPGTWRELTAPMRAEMSAAADKIALDWQASFAADPGIERLRELGVNTLLLRGDRSPQPMCRLVDALHRLMPYSARTIVPGANHTLPLTHASALIDAILLHLHAYAERRMN